MMTRTTEDLDRARRVTGDRRDLPRSAARTAGLYNEVTWDRSWTTAARPARAELAGRDHPVSPAE